MAKTMSIVAVMQRLIEYAEALRRQGKSEEEIRQILKEGFKRAKRKRKQQKTEDQ